MVAVCAEVVVRNEALFLTESLLSIKGCFDEIVVVDHGSIDETIDILNSLKPVIPEMKLFRMDGRTSYANCRNFVAENTRCDWLFKWDADFVAYDDEARNLSRLRKQIKDLAAQGTNLILIHAPNVGPTLKTTLRDKERAGGAGDIKVVRRDLAHYETAKFADTFVADPALLRRFYLNREDSPHFFVHLDRVKLPERLLLRSLMFQHDKIRFSGEDDRPFEEWLLRVFRPGELASRIERLMLDLQTQAVPFDFHRWGEHPKMLLDQARKEPMKFQRWFWRQRLVETGIGREFPRLRKWLYSVVQS